MKAWKELFTQADDETKLAIIKEWHYQYGPGPRSNANEPWTYIDFLLKLLRKEERHADES